MGHDGDAVGQAQNLGQLRGDHDDGLALLRQILEQRVNLILRAHVDAARRLVEDQDVSVTFQPLGHDDLLLVTAREAAQLDVH